MYSFAIASMFFWTVIGVAACAFIFQMVGIEMIPFRTYLRIFHFKNLIFLRQKLKDFDADAIMVIGVATTNILWIYLHCYLGKSVTERYDALPDHLFHSRWYTLPIELQMYFILLLVNTQEPLYFHGLGMYILNMGTFSAVSRKLFIIF